MSYFDAPDGTRLAYHVDGEGAPLVCLPGGPMRASAYLGDLGGLTRYRRLVRLDLRGTGASAVPTDPATYRCDRQADDVEALRAHFGRERIDLFANSAGAAIAIFYAIRYPDRVGQIVLAAPSPRAAGLRVSGEERRAVVSHRRGEPWFADAYAAFERLSAGMVTEADIAAIAPFHHGRWDEVHQAFEARRAHECNAEAADRYYAEGVIDAVAIREGLAHVDASVLVIAGEYDLDLPPGCAAEFTALFPHGRLVVQPRGGHFGWLDDPDWFVRAVTEFLL